MPSEEYTMVKIKVGNVTFSHKILKSEINEFNIVKEEKIDEKLMNISLISYYMQNNKDDNSPYQYKYD